MIPKEEVERAKKFIKASKEGGPGGCKGMECRDYCEKPENRETCFDFARKNGLVSEEDSRNFEAGQKLDAKLREAGGPGGCKSEEECKVYCSDASHVEECVAFAAAHGGISEEQAKMMLKQFTEKRFEGSRGSVRPQEGFGSFDEFESDDFRNIEKRFEEFRDLEKRFRGGDGFGEFPGRGSTEGDFPGQGATGGQFPGGFSGPGGCATPADCMKYCSEHLEDCQKFAPMGRPSETRQEDGRADERMRAPGEGFSGPGGCKGPEECAKYCLENSAECEKFGNMNRTSPDKSLPQSGDFRFDQRRQIPSCDEACQKSLEQSRRQFEQRGSTDPRFNRQPENCDENCRQRFNEEYEQGRFEDQQNRQNQPPQGFQGGGCDEVCQQKYREQSEQNREQYEQYKQYEQPPQQ